MDYSDRFRLGHNNIHSRHADESYRFNPPRYGVPAPERAYYHSIRSSQSPASTAPRKAGGDDVPNPPEVVHIYDRERPDRVPRHDDGGIILGNQKPSLHPSSRTRPPPSFVERGEHKEFQGNHRGVPPPPGTPSAGPVRFTSEHDNPSQADREVPPIVHGSLESPLRRSMTPGWPPAEYVRISPRLNRPEKIRAHDLATLAQRPFPVDEGDVKDKLILCVYRNSKRTFFYCSVDLKGNSHRLDYTKPGLTDRYLFFSMRREYERKLRGRVRQLLSFKVVSAARLLHYGNNKIKQIEQDDHLFSSIFMKIWSNPDVHLDKDSIEWVNWIQDEKARFPEYDIVIELVENYVPERIVLFVGFGILGIVALASAWLVEGGNPANVTTVMSFVLGIVATVIALTGIWDWCDSGKSEDIHKHNAAMLQTEWTLAPKRISQIVAEQLKGHD